MNNLIDLANMPAHILRKIKGVEGFCPELSRVRELDKNASLIQILNALEGDAETARFWASEAEHFASGLCYEIGEAKAALG